MIAFDTSLVRERVNEVEKRNLASSIVTEFQRGVSKRFEFCTTADDTVEHMICVFTFGSKVHRGMSSFFH
jgi:hypothetical protein